VVVKAVGHCSPQGQLRGKRPFGPQEFPRDTSGRDLSIAYNVILIPNHGGPDCIGYITSNPFALIVLIEPISYSLYSHSTLKIQLPGALWV